MQEMTDMEIVKQCETYIKTFSELTGISIEESTEYILKAVKGFKTESLA
jgi:hypothetical protein